MALFKKKAAEADALTEEPAPTKTVGAGATRSTPSKPKAEPSEPEPEKDEAKEFVRFSIRLKFASSIGALVIVVAGGLSAYFILNQIDTLRTNQQLMAGRELRVMSESASFGIVEEDPLRISDAYGLLADVEDILYSAVYSNAKNLFVQQEYAAEKRRGEEFQKSIDTILPDADLESALYNQTYLFFDDKVTSAIDSAFGMNKKDGDSFKVQVMSYPDPFAKGSQLTDYIYPIHSTITKSTVGVARITFTNDFIDRQIRETVIALLIVTAISFGIGLIGAFLLSNLIIRPINTIVQGAKKVAQDDDLKFQIKGVESRDEIGYLAQVFNQMVSELGIAQNAKIESSVLDDQIRQAQEIQEGMNPSRFYKKNGVQIKGYTKAAKGIGGDYYDYKVLPDGRVAVLISDVSGKSVSASLVMVMIKTALTANLQTLADATPDEIIHSINQIMCGEAHIDKFATIFLYIYDPVSKVLEFSNGGHGPLMVYRKILGKCTATKLEGLPLGIDDENEYNRVKVQLQEGDIVILETDGITEAWDPDKNEFGWERLQNLVIANSDKDAKTILNAVVDEVIEFEAGTPAHDDKTLVIMKIPEPGEMGFLEKSIAS